MVVQKKDLVEGRDLVERSDDSMWKSQPMDSHEPAESVRFIIRD